MIAAHIIGAAALSHMLQHGLGTGYVFVLQFVAFAFAGFNKNTVNVAMSSIMLAQQSGMIYYQSSFGGRTHVAHTTIAIVTFKQAFFDCGHTTHDMFDLADVHGTGLVKITVGKTV